MNALHKILFLTAVLSLPVLGHTQEIDFDFLNTNLSFDDRVDILIQQMTLDEKIAQMQYNAPAIPRLKVPEYSWWNECLHGVAFAGRATVFPEPIGLAATWNTHLVYSVAQTISDEARAKHNEFLKEDKRNNFQGLNFWAPNVNIFRDPRWGRGIETYGEDPCLTSKMGVAFVKGLQGNDEKYLKLIATPKHFAAHSGPEPERHRFNAIVSDKDLYETYLPQFKAAIQEGGAYSIMSAYNRLNGESCSGHPRLLTEILRDEWNFNGFVVSDCGAIRDIYEYHKIANSKEEAAAIALKSGCDLNCGDYYFYLNDAFAQGLIAESDIDKGLRRLFMARFKLGMFDPPEMVPYSQLDRSVVNSSQNQDLALQAALESIVLLKNENQVLPLSSSVRHIAVIGPNANDMDVLLGNYNGRPFSATTLLEGIQKLAPEGCQVEYSPGADWAEGVYLIEDLPYRMLLTENNGIKVQGLKGEYFASKNLSGQPVFSRIDSVLRFDWRDGAPAPELPEDYFSIRWTGKIKSDSTAHYLIGGEGHHGYKLYINDSLLIQEDEFYHTNSQQIKAVKLEKDKVYDIRIEFYALTGDANFRLTWVPNNRNLLKDALNLAGRSDVVVLCMGLSPRLEGEELGIYLDGFAGGDRTKLGLPANQLNLIQELARIGKPMVLVTLNGSPLALNWEQENIPAIVEAWYPGQAGGQAVAKVLWGDYNPSGKLPLTFYRSVDDLPSFEDYRMNNRTYRYFQGKPLYPFGFGLSYSSFKYSDLNMSDTVKIGSPLTISFNITNTSLTDGAEVAQLYLTNYTLSIPVELPKIALKGFQKVFLKAGESKKLVFELQPGDFSYVTETGKTEIQPGQFTIHIGSSSNSFSFEREIQLQP